MSNTVLTPNRETKTAVEPFFNDLESLPDAALAFSEEFCARYGKWLIEDRGVVLQSGLDQSGELTQLDDKTKANNLTLTLLALDGESRESSLYIWQYTTANPNSGRIVEQVMAGYTLEACRLFFDNQGRRAGYEEDVDPHPIMLKVEACTQSFLFSQYANKLEIRQQHAEMELERFKGERGAALSIELYDKMLEQKQKQVTNIGFVVLGLERAGGLGITRNHDALL